MIIKKPERKKPLAKVLISLEDQTWKKIKEIAAANDISASNLVRLIIADFLDKTGK